MVFVLSVYEKLVEYNTTNNKTVNCFFIILIFKEVNIIYSIAYKVINRKPRSVGLRNRKVLPEGRSSFLKHPVKSFWQKAPGTDFRRRIVAGC